MSQTSEKQLAANRANAQLSTGPKTEAGKAKSSVNAVTSALTGRTILLPTDDVPRYQNLVRSLVDNYRPVGYGEESLVQSIADTSWRLYRIPTLEAGIYSLGRAEYAAQTQDNATAEPLHPALVDSQTFFKYQRQLCNLSLQETRLRRMRDKDIVALRKLQEARQQLEEEQFVIPPTAVPGSEIALFMEAKRHEYALNLDQIGFDSADDSVAPELPSLLAA